MNDVFGQGLHGLYGVLCHQNILDDGTSCSSQDFLGDDFSQGTWEAPIQSKQEVEYVIPARLYVLGCFVDPFYGDMFSRVIIGKSSWKDEGERYEYRLRPDVQRW